MNCIIIKNGRVIDPTNNVDCHNDVLIEGNKIKAIAHNIIKKDALLIDASKYIVAPGLIDVHVHLREPGQTHKEDIYTGSKAALMGGFTSVICQPNTTPRVENAKIVKQIIKQAKKVGLINIYPSACISKGIKHENLVDIEEVKSAGAVKLTDDGDPVYYEDLMLKAMIEAKKNNIMVSPHCESSPWTQSMNIHNKTKSYQYTSRQAELFYVKRDIKLAKKSKAPLHISHISLKESLQEIKNAKKIGLPISCEVTPHHLVLTQKLKSLPGGKQDFQETIAKVNPPLRTSDDIHALYEGLNDGTITVIASDHAPHTPEEKNAEWEKAPPGIIGLETTVSIILTFLVNTKIISMKNAIAQLSTNPAKIFNLQKGSLTPGTQADICIIDPSKEWTVDVNKFECKSKISPFNNWKLKGKVVMTIVNGKIKMCEGKLQK